PEDLNALRREKTEAEDAKKVAKKERDTAIGELDTARTELSTRTAERDAAIQEKNDAETAKAQAEAALNRRADITPEDLNALRREKTEAEDAKKVAKKERDTAIGE